MTYDEWQAAVVWALKVERGWQFWVADLLAFGEQHYGDMYAHAMEATALSYQRLANMKNVARSVHPSRRRESLSFAHHQEVASLPATEQTQWLDKSEDERLTVSQLRSQIRNAKAGGNGHPIELWVAVQCYGPEDQAELAQRLRDEGRAVTLREKAST